MFRMYSYIILIVLLKVSSCVEEEQYSSETIDQNEINQNVSAVKISAIQPHIVSGQQATNVVPYITSIRYQGKHICGGTLIKSDCVVTAAHCIFGSESDYSISIGAIDRRDGETRDVIEIISHPKYVKKTYAYDAAVMKLDSPLVESNTIKVLPIATSSGDCFVKSARVCGWGDLKYQSSLTPPYRLRCASVIRRKCPNQSKYKRRIMLCFGGKIRDSCQGDSGGPLVANNKLCGIVSWGIGCASGTPGVYTNVSFVSPWIQANS